MGNININFDLNSIFDDTMSTLKINKLDFNGVNAIQIIHCIAKIVEIGLFILQKQEQKDTLIKIYKNIIDLILDEKLSMTDIEKMGHKKYLEKCMNIE